MEMLTVTEDPSTAQAAEKYAPDLTPEQRAKLEALAERRAAILGPKLTWLEKRLWERRHGYFDEYERLQETSETEWSPRVAFLYCEGPFRICPHGNAIPLWRHEHLIYIINRRNDAIRTMHAKFMATVRRIETIQFDVYWPRLKQLDQLRNENRRLRALFEPRPRRRRSRMA